MHRTDYCGNLLPFSIPSCRGKPGASEFQDMGSFNTAIATSPGKDKFHPAAFQFPENASSRSPERWGASPLTFILVMRACLPRKSSTGHDSLPHAPMAAVPHWNTQGHRWAMPGSRQLCSPDRSDCLTLISCCLLISCFAFWISDSSCYSAQRISGCPHFDNN